MTLLDKIKAFYLKHVPQATLEGFRLSAPCPLCKLKKKQPSGRMVVQLNPDSFFKGYFQCTNQCVPGGFAAHYARLTDVNLKMVPEFDPDAALFVLDVNYPSRHLGSEIDQFAALMGEAQLEYFSQFGVSSGTLKALHVGFNGRYLVFPYIQNNGYAYSARCMLAGKPEDHFWHGNKAFTKEGLRIFNVQEIERCEGGALCITVGELNLLILKQLGYPGIAVPEITDLVQLTPERLTHIKHLFLIVPNTPEAQLSARQLAVRVGYKTRILQWPSEFKRGLDLSNLALEKRSSLKKTLDAMFRQSISFSPFASPEKEQRRLLEFIEKGRGKTLLGIETGFKKLDQALDGLRGINIMGGPPKAGKSCFFMQISTQTARNHIPVIYYDFENGRQKIYVRTLVRLSHIAEKKMRQGTLNNKETETLQKAHAKFNGMLQYFRVVTDRQLTPEIMRRHIDFLKHETQKDDLLIVLDSLHKLPFKNLTERRTGIDSWLRHLEAIRDQEQVCFLVISELSRGKGGGYDEKPDLSAFKESGDIEYSADNAMVLMPNWDPLAPISAAQRENTLWVVASRESNPGKVADYVLDYPFWCFKEQ